MSWTLAQIICWRKSGPESITKLFPSTSSIIELRKRASFESDELHTRQLQQITGTPVDVPVPRKVTFKY